MGRSPSNPSNHEHAEQEPSSQPNQHQPDQHQPNQRKQPAESGRSPRSRSIDPELYARLQAEAKAPYRTLRRFLYVAFAASGFIGGFIFLSQVLAGQTTSDTLGNLAIQIGVVALMVVLLRIDRNKG